MYTVEMDHDEVVVTILDDTGTREDVIFNIFDDIVYVRQWDDFLDSFASIEMSPEMFDEFIAALNSPEGSYKIKKLTKK